MLYYGRVGASDWIADPNRRQLCGERRRMYRNTLAILTATTLMLLVVVTESMAAKRAWIIQQRNADGSVSKDYVKPNVAAFDHHPPGGKSSIIQWGFDSMSNSSLQRQFLDGRIEEIRLAEKLDSVTSIAVGRDHEIYLVDFRHVAGEGDSRCLSVVNAKSGQIQPASPEKIIDRFKPVRIKGTDKTIRLSPSQVAVSTKGELYLLAYECVHPSPHVVQPFGGSNIGGVWRVERIGPEWVVQPIAGKRASTSDSDPAHNDFIMFNLFSTANGFGVVLNSDRVALFERGVESQYHLERVIDLGAIYERHYSALGKKIAIRSVIEQRPNDLVFLFGERGRDCNSDKSHLAELDLATGTLGHLIGTDSPPRLAPSETLLWNLGREIRGNLVKIDSRFFVLTSTGTALVDEERQADLELIERLKEMGSDCIAEHEIVATALSLRERMKDLPTKAHHFLTELAEKRSVTRDNDPTLLKLLPRELFEELRRFSVNSELDHEIDGVKAAALLDDLADYRQLSRLDPIDKMIARQLALH